MTAPTYEEVLAEVAKLRELLWRVPRQTIFGDSNVAAIDAEIKALVDLQDEEDVYDDPDLYDNVLSHAGHHALAAVDWRLGRSTEVPSAGWAELITPPETPRCPPTASRSAAPTPSRTARRSKTATARSKRKPK